MYDRHEFMRYIETNVNRQKKKKKILFAPKCVWEAVGKTSGGCVWMNKQTHSNTDYSPAIHSLSHFTELVFVYNNPAGFLFTLNAKIKWKCWGWQVSIVCRVFAGTHCCWLITQWKISYSRCGSAWIVRLIEARHKNGKEKATVEIYSPVYQCP